MRNFTWQEVRIILTNMQWMLTHRPDGATFYPDSDTLVYGDGGVGMEVLAEEGFTPATAFPGWITGTTGERGHDESHIALAQQGSDGIKDGY